MAVNFWVRSLIMRQLPLVIHSLHHLVLPTPRRTYLFQRAIRHTSYGLRQEHCCPCYWRFFMSHGACKSPAVLLIPKLNKAEAPWKLGFSCDAMDDTRDAYKNHVCHLINKNYACPKIATRRTHTVFSQTHLNSTRAEHNDWAWNAASSPIGPSYSP